jgi:hypothetical protein
MAEAHSARAAHVLEDTVAVRVDSLSNVDGEAITTPPRAADFHSSGGEMEALIRATDWSQTPIGAPHAWSPTLRTLVGFLLANRFPLLLWWGPQYIQIYNDAYRPIPGSKHP